MSRLLFILTCSICTCLIKDAVSSRTLQQLQRAQKAHHVCRVSLSSVSALTSSHQRSGLARVTLDARASTPCQPLPPPGPPARCNEPSLIQSSPRVGTSSFCGLYRAKHLHLTQQTPSKRQGSGVTVFAKSCHLMVSSLCANDKRGPHYRPTTPHAISGLPTPLARRLPRLKAKALLDALSRRGCPKIAIKHSSLDQVPLAHGISSYNRLHVQAICIVAVDKAIPKQRTAQMSASVKRFVLGTSRALCSKIDLESSRLGPPSIHQTGS